MKAKLPYYESLGALLEDLGMGVSYIIGNKDGKEGIDWERLKANQIDREVTTHSPTETPLIRLVLRHDGTCVFENPFAHAEDGRIYKLLSAKFEAGAIKVKCNIMAGEDCQVREVSVGDLRNELKVARPNSMRLLFYSR